MSHLQRSNRYNRVLIASLPCVLRVSPVYRHIFPLSTAPTLSIIGLPWKVVPFPEFEVQAKWIARVLSKRVGLPSMQSMQNEVEEFYADLEHQNVPARCKFSISECFMLRRM